MGEKIQLLFVDDEEDFVNYMTKRLERHDFEVLRRSRQRK